ncbi:SUKH-4 family immunity protein [Actinoplanes sp. NPDC049596]|uniref:SUKH-4 family immunity protein n=1 Tax=unclassified Actinoplanes TaxID=2626549 RepID=UPI00343BDB12
MSAEWLPYSVPLLRRIGVEANAVRALGGRGLPTDTYQMFSRVPRRELGTRELPACGVAAFLGQHEDGLNTYWVSVADGSVWILRGYDGGGQRVDRINSSVAGLQGVLAAWDEFIGSGVYEDDPTYDGLVADAIDRARRADQEAFEDEESWWSIVFEEVENGVLAPE